MSRSYRAIGLMSGTSLDGVDAALIRTDGERIDETGAWLSLEYDGALREALRGVLGGAEAAAVATVERLLTLRHAEAVADLLEQSALAPGDVDVIGFHGQTILHEPERRRTWQIGDGALLAALTGIEVVNDFRSADVKAGGQGAPLAPLYHRALAADLELPLCVLNIGGVANVTWIGADGTLLAFDTGPGNALIDDWTRTMTGAAMDADGALAASGAVHDDVLLAMLENPYFDMPPPKSLDRNDFGLAPVRGLGGADGAATLTAFTVAAAGLARAFLPTPPTRWLVSGGGRHNSLLMNMLKDELKVKVEPCEAVGWRGDALEAEAFGFLAVRSLRGLATSLPTTTGIARPVVGGRRHKPGQRRQATD